MKNYIRIIRNYNMTLPLDRQINNEVLLILGLMAVVTGILNILIASFPLWYGVMFFIGSGMSAVLFLLNYYKGWYKLSKVVLVVVLYLMTIISWLFNGGINGSALLFISSIVVYTIGFYPQNYLLLVMLNFTVLTCLVLLNFFFPETLLFNYTSDNERIIDIISSYVIVVFSMAFILKVILNNYTRATKIIQMQKSELELLNCEMRKANDELKYLNASKDKLFSIIAHDLRSPMGSLLSLSGNLSENLNSYDKEKTERIVSLIHNTQQKTLSLLEELLLWAKSQSGKLSFEPVKISIKQVCNEIVKETEDMALSKNIAVICIHTESLYLNADLNMLKTVLRNLLSNALKFTNENGTITISSTNDGEYATIIVSDTGVGISLDKLSTLWDLGQNSSPAGINGESGSGLGLILCKEFVERHKGRIWAESTPGAGSHFKFTMPVFA